MWLRMNLNRTMTFLWDKSNKQNDLWWVEEVCSGTEHHAVIKHFTAREIFDIILIAAIKIESKFSLPSYEFRQKMKDDDAFLCRFIVVNKKFHKTIPISP